MVFKIFLDSQKAQFEETLSLLLGDKKKLGGEVEKLREDLERTQIKVGIIFNVYFFLFC